MRRIEYKKTARRAFYRAILTGCSALLAGILLTLQSFAVVPSPETDRVDALFREKEEVQQVRMLIPGGTPFGVRVYTKGVMVFRVAENSAAERCGLLAGDLITALNGEEFDGALDFSKKIAAIEDGAVTLDLQRGTEKLRIRVEKRICSSNHGERDAFGKIGFGLRRNDRYRAD